VRLLLDTQAFLWFVLNDSRISTTANELISDPQNDVFLSPASFWELAIKISIGKYRIPGDFREFMEHQFQQNDFEVLPIVIAHAAVVATLPFHHRDPFDRLLIAQTISEELSIVSADTVIDLYPVTRLW